MMEGQLLPAPVPGCVREMGVDVSDMAACGGGRRNPFWRQMLSDVPGCGKDHCFRRRSALGAAIPWPVMGAGLYATVAEGCAAAVRMGDVQAPVAGTPPPMSLLSDLPGAVSCPEGSFKHLAAL